MLGDLKSCCDATAYLTFELRVGIVKIATSEFGMFTSHSNHRHILKSYLFLINLSRDIELEMIMQVYSIKVIAAPFSLELTT